MNKRETLLEGLYRIEFQAFVDDRGQTIKTYSAAEFSQLGLPTDWTQTLRVTNPRRGTLRGMHWQAAPHLETKLVYCQRGKIFDVLVDVRVDSETFGKWCGFELSGDIPEALLVPAGLAHGYLTLEDESEMLYQVSGDYRPGAQRVFRWSDPAVGIDWPLSPRILAERDANAPLLAELPLDETL